MEDVKIKKDELAKIIKKNRKKHRALFEEAYEAYGAKVLDNLEATLRAAKRGKPQEVRLHFNLVKPEDHTDDYDRAIEMLKLDVRDEIVLTQREFAQLVQDDWGWKQAFATSYVSNTGKGL